MDLKNFEMGIVSFAENEILPNLHSSLDRWLMYAGLLAGGLQVEQKLTDLAPWLIGAGVMNGDGDINLDKLESIGAAAFGKQPDVKIWKFTFHEDDFRKFMAYLRSGGASA